MTDHEARVLGWLYGYIEEMLGEKHKPAAAKKALAQILPFTAFGEIHNLAVQHCPNFLEDEQINGACCEISSTDFKGHATLAQQTQWTIGYHAGRAGRPYPQAEFSIEESRRKKGLSQNELADMMGVAQPVISRWESGEVKPNAANLKKLHDMLD